MSAEPELATGDSDAESRTLASRLLVAGIVLTAVTVIGYFALGMPGMDHAPSTSTATGMAGMDMTGTDDMNGHPIDVAAFAAGISNPDGVVINVHVPDEGSIVGTDLTIPFDQIEGDGRLPTDLDTPVLLYCQSGRMSQIAADTLTAAGYRNVVQLDGGMNAWRAAGRKLAPE